jgi:GSH-dependent disulfide-bond oxidoreductase
MADHASRRAAALLLSYVQWRQGLDHIGRAWPAVRSAFDRRDSQRNLDAAVSDAESEREDPGDHRSGWTGRHSDRFESGAILLYLAEKTGKLLPASATERYKTIQWVFFQMAGVGPTFGQLGYFHKFAGREIEDKRPLERYRSETQRLLGVLEQRLEGREWIMGDIYTIADISLIGWVRNLTTLIDAGDLVHYDELKSVPAWLQRCLARVAVQRGLNISPRPAT